MSDQYKQSNAQSSYSDTEVEQKFRKGECYLCGGTEWLQGPYEDVECAGCGIDLNVNPLSVTRVGWNMSDRFNQDGTLKRRRP